MNFLTKRSRNCNNALSWIKSKNYDRIQVEIVSPLVVQGLKSIEGLSSFDLILNDVKDMWRLVTHSSISFVKRFTNRTTHALVRESTPMTDCSE